MKEEIWKPVMGYEGLYEVSNFGRVRRLNKKGEHILKLIKDKYGYLRVHLSVKQISKKILVHRLVAQAFIPNPDNLPQVNHKDENKTNNRVENLEWCTAAYNCSYSNSKKVFQFDINGSYVNEWESAREIERKLGYDSALIGRVCLNKKKTAYGFKWSYAA